MTLLRNKTIKYFYLFLVILLFIIGFLSRENIAGAAETDFKIYLACCFIFKRDFVYSIINYGKFGEGSTPLFHILNAYLNPFTFNQIAFKDQ